MPDEKESFSLTKRPARTTIAQCLSQAELLPPLQSEAFTCSELKRKGDKTMGNSYYYRNFENKPLVKKHGELLKLLADKKRVFAVEWYEGRVMLVECCDHYFGHGLTKEECLELSDIFRGLAEEEVN